MIIKNISAKNAFNIKELNLDLKEGQLVFVKEELDPMCSKDFFYLLRCIFDEKWYEENIGTGGKVSAFCLKNKIDFFVDIYRETQRISQQVYNKELVGKYEKVETKVLYNKETDYYQESKIYDNFREYLLPSELKNYCFYEYDTIYCALEVLHSELLDNKNKPARYPDQNKKIYELYQDFLSKIGKFKIKDGLFLSFDKQGKKCFLDSNNNIVKEESLKSQDENFAEIVEFCFANKCMQEICRFLEKDCVYPIFFRGALDSIREEQIPLVIFLLKDLNTQVFVVEPKDFANYKNLFDVFVDLKKV